MLESVIEGYLKDDLSLYLGSGILKVLSRVISKTTRVFTSVVVFGQVSFWLSQRLLESLQKCTRGLSQRLLESLPRAEYPNT